MTYQEAMDAARFQNSKIARRNHLWKQGTYVIYHDGTFGGDVTFTAFPLYRLIEGKKMKEYQPSIMDIMSEDWFVLQERSDKNGKG